MADLSALQERAEGTKIQTARMVEQHHRFLVPLLPVFIEHVHDV
jgi:hypothetical protein